MKKVLLIILSLILAGILLLVILYIKSPEHTTQKQFKDIMKQQGEFTKQQKIIHKNLKETPDKSKIFKEINIATNQVLSSPFLIQGKANVYWFPEGWFQIVLVDKNGNEITSINANASVYPLVPDKNGFIPFVGQLSFHTSETEGVLIFKENKSSKLSLGDYKIPVKLKIN